MRLQAGIAILGAAWALGGCGTNERDVVRAKVEQFVKAAAGRDYKTLCNQVLAPPLLARLTAAGVGCERAMQIAFSSVQNPTLSIGRIEIAGQTARAITLTTATGQLASLDAVELVKTSRGWRVSSLGSPVK